VWAGKKHTATAIEIIGNHGAVLDLKSEGRRDQLCRDLEEPLRQRHEFRFGETAMPFIHRLCKRDGNAGADADQRGLLAAEFGGNLVSGTKADAADVARQTVRVLRDQADSTGTVNLASGSALAPTDRGE